jgi:HEAT repeat protein
VDDLGVSLQAPRAATRLAAVEALARLRDPRASDMLTRALHDEDPAIRRAAVVAFGRLGTTSIASAIAALSESDPDPDVRRVAATMCRRHRWPCGARE